MVEIIVGIACMSLAIIPCFLLGAWCGEMRRPEHHHITLTTPQHLPKKPLPYAPNYNPYQMPNVAGTTGEGPAYITYPSQCPRIKIPCSVGMELFKEPSEEQSRRMREELAKDTGHRSRDDIHQAVQAIRHWLTKQRHLPQHIDDIGLERFLYGCKFSLERTKMLLERYYTARAAIPELFKDRDPKGKALQNNFDACYYFPLPGYTDKGYRVTIFRLREPTNPERFNLQDSAKRVLMTMDIRLLTESCLNNITVFDLYGFTAQHYAKCTPTLTSTRRAQMAIQDAFPMRLAQVHYINVPKALEKAFSLALPLFKPKLVNKFFFHSEGAEVLYDYMPKKILPRDYGGDAPSLEELNEAWREKILSNRNWFLAESQKGFADESKRIEGKNNFIYDFDFASSGSFQKLSID